LPQPSRGEGADEVRSEHGIIGGLGDCKRLFRGRTSASRNEESIEAYLIRAAEGRTMTVGSGVGGGYFAPEAWSREILQTVNSESVCLPRCRVFPMSEANTLHITLWNSEDQTEGYFGGITPEWRGEDAVFTAKSPKMRSTKLGAWKLGLYVNLSRECVQDANGIANEVSARMSFALAATFDEQILTGNGVARPLGVINSPASVVVPRAAANLIDWPDVVLMLASLHPAFVANSAWYCNPSCLSQLLTVADAGNNALWIPSGAVSSAMPGYLYGRPLFVTDKVPVLGQKGDLVLADLSMYAVGIRQQVSVERSESVEWYNDLVSLRTILRCDGTPLLDRPITPKNGSALSAFVVLG
jgi:HK97 family phage major capsid protein